MHPDSPQISIAVCAKQLALQSINRYLFDGGVSTFLAMTVREFSSFLPFVFGGAELFLNVRNAIAPAPLYSKFGTVP